MFVTKVITFLEVIREYEHLLVEANWHGNSKGGSIWTYTYRHPSDEKHLTLSLMTMSNHKWLATLQGRFSKELASSVFPEGFCFSKHGTLSSSGNVVDPIPEATKVVSEEELCSILNHFVNC